MTRNNKKLDLNQLAARIVGDATGEVDPTPELSDKEKAANKKKRLPKLNDNKIKNPR